MAMPFNDLRTLSIGHLALLINKCWHGIFLILHSADPSEDLNILLNRQKGNWSSSLWNVNSFPTSTDEDPKPAL